MSITLPSSRYKKIGYFCALPILLIGISYLLRWSFFSPIPEGPWYISYSTSLGLIIFSLSLLSFYRSSWYTKLLASVLILLNILKYTYPLLANEKYVGEIPLFLYPSNLITILSLLLIGSFFLIWDKKRESIWQYLYGFFVCSIVIGLTIIGFIADTLDLNPTFIHFHVISLIIISIGCLGIISLLIDCALEKQLNLHAWIPSLVGLTLLVLSIPLTFALYFNLNLEKDYSLLILIYAFSGGLLFTLSMSYLIYFFLLSKQQVKQLKEAQQELELVRKRELSSLEGGKTGTWQWNLQTDELITDDYFHELFHLKGKSFPEKLQDFYSLIHPKDHYLVQSAIKDSVETKKPYEITYRTSWPDHSMHYIYAKANLILDPNETPIFLTGIATDVTSNKYPEYLLEFSAATLKIISEASSIAALYADLSYCLTNFFEWNDTAIWIKSSELGKYEYLKYKDLEQNPFDIEYNDSIVDRLSREANPIAIAKNEDSKHLFSVVHPDICSAVFIPILEGTRLEGILGCFSKNLSNNQLNPLLSHSLLLLGLSIGKFLHKIQIQNSLKEMGKIIDVLQLPTYTLQVNGVIHTWNPAAEQLFGWTAEEILGKKLEDVFPSIAQEEQKIVNRILIENINFSRVFSVRRTKFGKPLSVEAFYSSFVDENGVKKIVVSIQDVSQEKAAQDVLRQTEEKFHSFVENAEEWVWETDIKGIFTYSNPAIKAILGYSPQQIIGQSIYTNVLESHQKELEKYILQEQSWQKWIVSYKDMFDKERILESSGTPILDDSGECIGFRGTNLDITERVLLEKNKNEFISIIGHEIKSPLTSIHGALGLIFSEPNLPSKVQELITIAHRNCSSLVQLVQDIIDIEKIELGKFSYSPQKICLNSIVRQAIDLIKVLSDKKGLLLAEELSADNPYIYADPERLLQVLGNFLSNAVKFSPPKGTIFITTEIHDTKVRCAVHDQGPGVPKEFLPKIFGRFTQSYIDIPKEQKGSGLGLNIAKTIVEQMGGTIGVFSEFPKGAKFYFDFPVIDKD